MTHTVPTFLQACPRCCCCVSSAWHHDHHRHTSRLCKKTNNTQTSTPVRRGGQSEIQPGKANMTSLTTLTTYLNELDYSHFNLFFFFLIERILLFRCCSRDAPIGCGQMQSTSCMTSSAAPISQSEFAANLTTSVFISP